MFAVIEMIAMAQRLVFSKVSQKSSNAFWLRGSGAGVRAEAGAETTGAGPGLVFPV
jgi:hypothetical protein